MRGNEFLKEATPMPLTDTALRAVKPLDKQQKFFDGNGLFLAVSPSGTKSWRLKYYHAGKEKLLTLGQYPVVSLKDARERAMEAKKTLSTGKDPSVEKKHKKLLQQNSFELLAREWHEKQSPVWSPAYAQNTMRRLVKYLFPHIGMRPIADISGPELLAVLRKRETHGAVAEAHVLRGVCGSIFRYAVATGRAERDPSADIRGALTAHSSKSRAAITDPEKVGQLLLKIDNYHGSCTVRNAIRLLALTFCRPSEVCNAEWEEFNLSDMLWRIPASKMKMSRDHLVPISRQTAQLLETMRSIAENSRYVFPSLKLKDMPIGRDTMTQAMRIMGIGKEEMCPHGFRAMASTLLNEQGYHGDVIERQLAHVPHQRVRAIYNQAEYLPERRRMMQEWADYLSGLKEKAKNET
jgi:integrase